MGAVLGVCTVGQLACCCTSSAASLACSACGTCYSSTTTRFMYAFMLLVSTIVSRVMMSDWMSSKLQEMPFCKYNMGYDKICQETVGYLTTYRIMFAQTIFFLLFGLIMLNVKSSRDGRAGLHNGFWGIKYLIVIGLAIGAFYIPEQQTFGSVWMYFGLIGGFLFILIQLVFIIEFAHSLAEKLVAKYEETYSKCYYFFLIFFTAVNYAIVIASVALLFIYYGQEGCGLQKFFISFTLILTIAISIISVLPQVQEITPNSGVLQASFISLYSFFLVWSALNNSSNGQCKPSVFESNNSHLDSHALITLIVWFGCLAHSVMRMSTKNLATGQETSQNVLISENGEGQAVEVEEEGTVYSWSGYHFMLALATLYVMMTLTGWYRPDVTSTELTQNDTAMWMKIISCWICIGLYTWSLIAPAVLTNRDFD